MSDYPQVIGPHIVNLPDLATYMAWMRTHFEQIPDPGEVWIFNLQSEGLTSMKVGDGIHMFGELKNIKDPKKEIKYYKVSETDLRELLAAAHQFWALEQGGVDNWSWCGASCCDYLEQYNDDQGTNFDDFESLAAHELTSYTIIS